MAAGKKGMRSTRPPSLAACEPKLPKLSPGFIIEGDVNGDGVKDYVLDYGAFRCGRQLFFCGTAGCLTQVFASLSDGGHVKVLDENVRSIKFRMLKGRPAMILDLHGTACGKVGAAPCSATLFWNGERFRPKTPVGLKGQIPPYGWPAPPAELGRGRFGAREGCHGYCSSRHRSG